MVLRAAGTFLLLCAGVGIGYAAAARLAEEIRRIHTFARLLKYLAGLLEACALTGPELLGRGARCPEFSAFCPPHTAALSALLPPPCLPEALRLEIRQTLAEAEESPRQSACAALHRLAALCEQEAAARAEHCRAARRLWPRLGGCLGALTAILLW